jgi:hypothetical protein
MKIMMTASVHVPCCRQNGQTARQDGNVISASSVIVEDLNLDILDFCTPLKPVEPIPIHQAFL